jgi:DNA repair exonuclease SbcCD ATPase subunit
MGRPPIGKQAMSGAERQRRYLERLLAGKSSVTKSSAPADTADTAKLEAENKRLQARIAELEHKLALARTASGKVPESVAEMDAMRRIGEELDAAKRARAKAERLAKAPPVDAGETLETLAEKLRHEQQLRKAAQTRIRNLNAKIDTLIQRKKIPYSKALVRYVRSVLHPDRVTAPKERERLEQLSQEFNSFEYVAPEL